MITFENTTVMNMKNAMLGARNPMNSWDRSDSKELPDGTFQFGPKDMDLAKRLIKSGSLCTGGKNMTPIKSPLRQIPPAPCIRSTQNQSNCRISAMII